MSDYTPTTDEVRDRYAVSLFHTEHRLDGHVHDSVSDGDPEFERWLAAHDQEVAARAWDEGFDAGEKDAWDVDVTNESHVCTPNPYRSRSEGSGQ